MDLRWYYLLLLLCVVVLVCVSCAKYDDDETRYSDQRVCELINANVEFIMGCIDAFENGEIVDVVSYSFVGDSLRRVTIVCGDDKQISYNSIVGYNGLIPRIEVQTKGNTYQWSVDGTGLSGTFGSAAEVSFPRFRVDDGVWRASIDDSVWTTVDSSRLVAPKAFVVLSAKHGFVIGRFGKGCQIVVPTTVVYSTLRNDVRNKAFYRDVFLDAGVALNNGNSLNAIKSLGLTCDYIDCRGESDSSWQNSIISGDATDVNGRLLYPDGQPRYKVLFVRGGTSAKHGQSLRASGRSNMRLFVDNGGSYIGTCAGAFFASAGSDLRPNYKYYLSLWPGHVIRTNYKDTYTGCVMESSSPLLRYDATGTIAYHDSMYHSEGCYPFDMPQGTKVLARYVCPERQDMHLQPMMWQYRKSPYSGLVLLMGSHPEFASRGKSLLIAQCMLRYAIDNVGCVTVKSLLTNGRPRVMDKSSRDNMPAYSMIGDMQCHHFAFYLPAGARNIRLSADTDVDCSLQLAIDDRSYAFPDDARYCSNTEDNHPELLFDTLHEGLYYVAVKNLTTVTSTNTDYCQSYSGRTDVLNGVPYSVCVAWDNE